MSAPDLSQYSWEAGPAIVPTFSKKQGGVDPLGLRQVNLDMMGLCLPGITNTTNHIRPFSLLCWIHWKFSQQAKAAGLAKVSRAQQRLFQQKVETLFTWSHKLEGVTGVPGLRSVAPPGEAGGWTDLTFKSWNRKPANTSLQAAVQYGPALKVRSGYGFVDSADGMFFRATILGEQMAKQLDEKLRKSAAYSLVTDLERSRGRQKDAKELFDLWRVDNPSTAERHTFESVFFLPGAIDDEDAQGMRSATVHAILQILKASRRGLDEDEIRRALAWQRLPNGRPVSLKGGPMRSARHWLALQVRQAQRASLEWMLNWVEQKLVENVTSPAALKEALNAELASEKFSSGGKLTCEQTLKKFRQRFTTLDEYAEASAGGSDRCFFELMYSLNRAREESTEVIVQRVVALQLATLMLTEFLEEEPAFQRDLKLGSVSRISLSYQLERWRRFKDREFRVWMGDILERWVIGQHLSVGTLRYDGFTQRLRFSLEESGLEFYADHPFRPDISRDHLASALSLMSEVKLVDRSEHDLFNVH